PIVPAHPAKSFPRILALLAVLGPLAPSSQAAQAATPHCGTGLWMSQRLEARTLPGGSQYIGGSLRARAQTPTPARMLETEHFRIRYVMRGLNRVKTLEEDAALVALADSLFAATPLSEGRADSAVYAQLEKRGAPHPRYIRALADIFEAAYRYYVDTLKMRAPREMAPSVYYGGPAHPRGKYPVDVADIGTAHNEFWNQEYYALTYPTGSGGMLIENDFLFRVSGLDSRGIPVGTPISSRYDGRLLHDYSKEWDLGLKVTGYHEFYHAVQFAYTPDVPSFHLWYETSATGMEEREAPEVNDYLQYLPSYMEDLTYRGMLAFPGDGLARYGNAVFHEFLRHDLDETFDVHLWERLAANGNRLEDALSTTFARYGTNSQAVMARFAAQLAFSGTTIRNPLPAFSPDLPRWPRLPRQSLVAQASGFWTFPNLLSALSVGAVTITGTGARGNAAYLQDTLLRITLARLGKDTGAVEFHENRVVLLDMPSEEGKDGEVVAMVSNGSLETSLMARTFEVRPLASRVDSEVYAYPNPMARNFGTLFFSRAGNGAAVDIFSENGTRVRSLAFTAEEGLWSWDLADGDGRRAKPGLYYYRVDSGPLRPVFLR
ncbi:MAG TPA: hypothetical protein VK465_13495, partial [Fibrobacteria bacterium]|nr:hypothetical protein [Fibrobacteria bacterium]